MQPIKGITMIAIIGAMLPRRSPARRRQPDATRDETASSLVVDMPRDRGMRPLPRLND